MFEHDTAHALHSILLFDTIYYMNTQSTITFYSVSTWDLSDYTKMDGGDPPYSWTTCITTMMMMEMIVISNGDDCDGD